MSSTLILDSGVGGLSVLVKMINVFPDKEFLYFSDAFYFPYGKKEPAEVHDRIHLVLSSFLKSANLEIDSVILACHTASAILLSDPSFTDAYDIPIYNIVEPTAFYLQKAFSCEGADKPQSNIFILGTSTLLKSGIYQQRLGKAACQLEMRACPDLVLHVESSVLEGEEVENRVARHLQAFHFSPRTRNIIVLGCTHFPFLMPVFKSVLHRENYFSAVEAERVEVIDPADCFVNVLTTQPPFKTIPPRGNTPGLSDVSEKSPLVSFYTSGHVAAFEYKARSMLHAATGMAFDACPVSRLDVGHL